MLFLFSTFLEKSMSINTYWILKFFAGLSGLAAASYVLVCCWLYISQVSLLFPGEQLPKDFQFRELKGVGEVMVPVDNAYLSALHFKNPSPKGLIFFLHGNAGNLDSWVPDVDFYREEAFDLFMIDYRGYGKSTGKIVSEKQLIEDVQHAWQFVSPEYQRSNIPIMIYGRSIGTFLAADLASKVDHDALVLVSPYSSGQQLVKEKLPWLPPFLLRFKLDTYGLWKSASDTLNPLKTFLLHGADDGLIPVDHSRRLAGLADGITLIEVEGAAHGDIHDFSVYQATMSRVARSIGRF